MTYETPVGANMFAYCMNNPVRMVDDDGELPQVLVGALIGGSVNVVTTFIAAKVTGQSYSLKDGGLHLLPVLSIQLDIGVNLLVV